MTVLFTDSGAGADANPIAGAYTTISGFSDMRRVSNQVTGQVSSSNNGAYINSVTPPDDQYFKLTYQQAVLSSGGGGPMCRTQTGSASGYLLQVFGVTIALARFDSGGYTSLATAGYTYAQGDVVQIQAVGTTIKAFLNGAEVLSTTDSTYTSGRFGVYAFSEQFVYTTLEGGDFAAAQVKTAQGLALASVKTLNGLALASAKTLNGLGLH
jgi:hypothetical protein